MLDLELTKKILFLLQRKVFNLDEEKIEYALGNKELFFWQGKKDGEYCILIYDVGTRGIIWL